MTKVDELPKADLLRVYARDLVLAYGSGRSFRSGWQADAAYAIGISDQQLSGILHGRRPVGDAMLERVRTAMCSDARRVSERPRAAKKPRKVTSKPPTCTSKQRKDEKRKVQQQRRDELASLLAAYGERRGHGRGWKADAATILEIYPADLSKALRGKHLVSEDLLRRAKDRLSSPVSSVVEKRRAMLAEEARARRVFAREAVEAFGEARGFARGWKTEAAYTLGVNNNAISGILREKWPVSERAVETIRRALESCAHYAHRPRI